MSLIPDVIDKLHMEIQCLYDLLNIEHLAESKRSSSTRPSFGEKDLTTTLPLDLIDEVAHESSQFEQVQIRIHDYIYFLSCQETNLFTVGDKANLSKAFILFEKSLQLKNILITSSIYRDFCQLQKIIYSLTESFSLSSPYKGTHSTSNYQIHSTSNYHTHNTSHNNDYQREYILPSYSINQKRQCNSRRNLLVNHREPNTNLDTSIFVSSPGNVSIQRDSSDIQVNIHSDIEEGQYVVNSMTNYNNNLYHSLDLRPLREGVRNNNMSRKLLRVAMTVVFPLYVVSSLLWGG